VKFNHTLLEGDVTGTPETTTGPVVSFHVIGPVIFGADPGLPLVHRLRRAGLGMDQPRQPRRANPVARLLRRPDTAQGMRAAADRPKLAGMPGDRLMQAHDALLI
jgi:hypothetical protein